MKVDYTHEDSKTFDEEKFMEDIEKKYIEQHTTHIKCYTQKYVDEIQQELERYKNIIDEIESIVYANISNIDARISIQEALDKLKGE